MTAIGLAWAWLAKKPGDCANLQVGASYAGSTDRFTNYLGGTHHQVCTLSSLGPARWWLLLGIAAAGGYGLVLWLLLRHWWSKAWVTAHFRSASVVTLVGPVAAAFDVVENIVTMLGVHVQATTGGRPPVALRPWSAAALPVLAWSKLLCYGIAGIALVATMVSAWNRRQLDREAGAGKEDAPPATADGLGICCSGGGIRAAAISLGALGALEAHDRTVAELPVPQRAAGPNLLTSANYLASVSGGGYACTAWRTATGPGFDPGEWPIGVIGDPFHSQYESMPPTAYDSETTESPPSVYRHMQARREFLRTGRGGLPASIAIAVACMLGQLVVLFLSIALVAWPMGRLARMWPVFGGTGCQPTSAIVRADLPPSLCGATAANGTTTAPTAPTCTAPANDARFEHSPARTTCFLTTNGRQMPLHRGLVLPPLVAAALALLAFLPKLTNWRTKTRHRLSIIAGALTGAALLYAVVLLGVPLLLDVIYPHLRTTNGLRSLVASVGLTGASAGIAGSVLAFGKKTATSWLKKSLDIAGRLLLAITVVLVGTVVAGQAALGSGLLNHLFGLHGWPSYFIGAGIAIALYLVANPQVWSLNTLYRNRIRGGFAVTRNPDQAPKRLRRERTVVQAGDTAPGTTRDEKTCEPLTQRLYPYRLRDEPLLTALAGRTPRHLVCCSAARKSASATGVKSLSFVIDAEHVTLYEPQRRGATVKVITYEANTTDYLAALAGLDKTDGQGLGPRLRRRRQQAYGTTSAAATASAAAFASAMGRFARRYPTALFGAFNLRLGAWLPNPRFLETRPARFPTPDLVHLLKEITGFWRLDDHHLYVSDGGHRENLGLVELLRRRCRTIVCIDASGDTPGSYTTLRQAVDLARIEGRARVDTTAIDTPPAVTRPPVPFTVLAVEYRDATGETAVAIGTIIHVRPVIYPALRDELVAFAAEDADFPHYSTGNQFLTDQQFRHLVQYGWEATTDTLADPTVADLIRATLGAVAPPPPSVPNP